MRNKYDPLRKHLLAAQENILECTLSFSDIERLIGQALPSSALNHRAWWSNQARLDNRPQAKAWMGAGFMVDSVHQGVGGWVRFKRTRISAGPTLMVNDRQQATDPAFLGKPDYPVSAQRSEAYSPGTIALVSCVATKGAETCAAGDLYISSWFKKVRQHVEAAGLEWYILSAKYGLLHPDQQIEPYELTLNNMSIRGRQDWARRVLAQIHELLADRHTFVMFAGCRYREFLQPQLEADGAVVRVPMMGLTQGRQLNWLDSHQAHVQA